ncbi:hypothetical protein WMF45_50100 [Sorangium sp. So ce448]|uniref:hypothetical protein n=1 Tax=Sorangium sp. So ce448 TaxID=3133314 RepID=UPI003F5FD2CE
MVSPPSWILEASYTPLEVASDVVGALLHLVPRTVGRLGDLMELGLPDVERSVQVSR